jgi:hypothetical protein
MDLVVEPQVTYFLPCGDCRNNGEASHQIHVIYGVYVISQGVGEKLRTRIGVRPGSQTAKRCNKHLRIDLLKKKGSGRASVASPQMVRTSRIWYHWYDTVRTRVRVRR